MTSIPEATNTGIPVIALQAMSLPGGIMARIPKAVLLQAFDFLDMETRASLHGTSKRHKACIEERYYGSRDFITQGISQQYAALKWISPEISSFGYNQAMKLNKITRKMMALFGGRKQFERLPILQVEKLDLDRIPIDSMTAPIMRGILRTREFLALRIKDEDQTFVRIFIHLNDEETWNYNANQRGLLWGMKGDGYFISNGVIQDLRIYDLHRRLIHVGVVDLEYQTFLSSPPRMFHYELV